MCLPIDPEWYSLDSAVSIGAHFGVCAKADEQCSQIQRSIISLWALLKYLVLVRRQESTVSEADANGTPGQ